MGMTAVASAEWTTPVQAAIDRVRRALELSDVELASALGVSVHVLQTWSTGGAPSAASLDRLRRLEALADRLQETFRAPGGMRWLRSESLYLGGQRPIDALSAGDFARIDSALEALDSGIFI